jgi:molecular chaperone HscB
MEYFELFDLPVSLVVDQKAVTKKYYELSKKYHPDNFSLDDVAKQDQALEMSSKINKAKKILSNSNARLAYILRAREIVLPEEKYKLPPLFLGEMMDVNEALMELQFEPNKEEQKKISIDVKQKEDELFEEVRKYFEAEELELNKENNSLLKEYYYKKKYLDRIQEKL